MSPLAGVRHAFDEFTAHTEDNLWAVDAVMAVFVAHRWSHSSSPCWLYLLGPSSSGKDVITRAFRLVTYHHHVTKVTSHALLSAYDPKEEGPGSESISALKEWNDRVVIFTEATAMIETGVHAFNNFLAQLREAYGGEFVQHSGTKGVQKVESRFNLILACTPDLEQVTSRAVSMGERFLTIKIGRPARSIRDRAMRTREVGKKAATRHLWEADLARAVAQQVHRAVGLLTPSSKVEWPKEDLESLSLLTELLMFFRSRVSRGVIQDVAEATRVANSIRILTDARAIADNRKVLDDSDRYFIRRLVWDSLDRPAQRMVTALCRGPVTRSNLLTLSGYQKEQDLTDILTQWSYSEPPIIEVMSKGPFRLTSEIREAMEETRFLDGLKGGPS